MTYKTFDLQDLDEEFFDERKDVFYDEFVCVL